MQVNPTVTPPLECTTQSNLPEGAEVSYTWTLDGDTMAGKVDEMLLVSSPEGANETVSQMYACSAAVVGFDKLPSEGLILFKF